MPTPAGFAERLLAVLIDGLILVTLILLLTAPGSVYLITRVAETVEVRPDGTVAAGELAKLDRTVFAVNAGMLLVGLIVTYVYKVEMLLRDGQTIGKRAMRIRVVPIDPAETLTRRRAAKRWLLDQAAGTLIPFFYLLDGAWQLWDRPYRQCLHDKFARTVVVRTTV